MSGSSPTVGLNYANGSANTVRPTGMDYPSGRTLTYDYGTSGGISDHASRIASLIDNDGTTHLADYSFLGPGAIVVVDFTEPDVKYTLVDLSGSNDPDTGDIYSGLDRFGRVKDCRWYDYGSSADVARLKYGYDRASNRLWRADTVAQAAGKDFDELYSYDGLHRLQTMERGLLDGGHTAISSQTYGQCWNLDATGNWTGMKEADGGSTWTLQQSRTANPVNEITGITNTVGSAWAQPAYDPAGNMTTIPQPADPTQSYTATYDAWNRLVKLVDGSNTVQENQYDARTFSTVRKDYTGGTLSETRHFYYDPGWRCVEERVGASTNPNRQYVWGLRYIDDLVLRDRDTGGGTLNERLYGLQDANWNMVALVDAAGAVQERYAYAPYGDVVFLSAVWATLSGSAVDNGYTFTGRELDAGTGLLYFRYRYLNVTLGTFVRIDPLGYLPGTNLFAYVNNSPLSATDPYGLEEPWEFDGGFLHDGWYDDWYRQPPPLDPKPFPPVSKPTWVKSPNWYYTTPVISGITSIGETRDHDGTWLDRGWYLKWTITTTATLNTAIRCPCVPGSTAINIRVHTSVTFVVKMSDQMDLMYASLIGRLPYGSAILGGRYTDGAVAATGSVTDALRMVNSETAKYADRICLAIRLANAFGKPFPSEFEITLLPGPTVYIPDNDPPGQFQQTNWWIPGSYPIQDFRGE